MSSISFDVRRISPKFGHFVQKWPLLMFIPPFCSESEHFWPWNPRGTPTSRPLRFSTGRPVEKSVTSHGGLVLVTARHASAVRSTGPPRPCETFPRQNGVPSSGGRRVVRGWLGLERRDPPPPQRGGGRQVVRGVPRDTRRMSGSPLTRTRTRATRRTPRRAAEPEA